MKCEICGNEATLKRVMVEGVDMMVCHECSKYGTSMPEKRKTILKLKKKSPPYSKDVFQGMDKMLISNWGKIIKEAREKKGMNREELGSKAGEKTTTIAKIENEEFRPPDATMKKIEKILSITLFQTVEKGVVKSKEIKPFTLGDLLKNAK